MPRARRGRAAAAKTSIKVVEKKPEEDEEPQTANDTMDEISEELKNTEVADTNDPEPEAETEAQPEQVEDQEEEKIEDWSAEAEEVEEVEIIENDTENADMETETGNKEAVAQAQVQAEPEPEAPKTTTQPTRRFTRRGARSKSKTIINTNPAPRDPPKSPEKTDDAEEEQPSKPEAKKAKTQKQAQSQKSTKASKPVDPEENQDFEIESDLEEAEENIEGMLKLDDFTGEEGKDVSRMFARIFLNANGLPVVDKKDASPTLTFAGKETTRPDVESDLKKTDRSLSEEVGNTLQNRGHIHMKEIKKEMSCFRPPSLTRRHLRRPRHQAHPQAQGRLQGPGPAHQRDLLQLRNPLHVLGLLRQRDPSGPDEKAAGPRALPLALLPLCHALRLQRHCRAPFKVDAHRRLGDQI